jgi:hypothetical protein
MNTKLSLQVLLLLGCVALAMAMLEAATGRVWVLAPRGWWEGAVACWLLVIAIRTVYPAGQK